MLESPLRSFLDKRLRHGYALRKRRRRHAKKKSEMFSVPVPSPAALKRLWQQGAGSHKKPQYVICDVGGVWGEGLCGAGELRAHQRQHLCVVKDGLIVEYKKIVLQSGQYVWLDCEAEEIMK